MAETAQEIVEAILSIPSRIIRLREPLPFSIGGVAFNSIKDYPMAIKKGKEGMYVEVNFQFHQGLSVKKSPRVMPPQISFNSIKDYPL